MNKTPIEWTDLTSNPIRARYRITGATGHTCEKISPGCKNCYASRLQPRFGMPTFDGVSPSVDPFLDEGELQKLLKRRKPCKVFLGDMTDIFGDWVPDEWLDRIFAVMALTPHVTYQILTKRSVRMKEYIMGVAYSSSLRIETAEYKIDRSRFDATFRAAYPHPWPLPNVHLGVSVETQEYDYRITDLLATPAAVRYVSYEPALGPLKFVQNGVDYLVGWKSEAGHDRLCDGSCRRCPVENQVQTNKLDWIICGGESGPGARPMHPDWARSVRDQCVAAGVPFFFKQWGAWTPATSEFGIQGSLMPESADKFRWIGWDAKTQNPSSHGLTDPVMAITRVGKKVAGRLLDGREWNEFPL